MTREEETAARSGIVRVHGMAGHWKHRWGFGWIVVTLWALFEPGVESVVGGLDSSRGWRFGADCRMRGLHAPRAFSESSRCELATSCFPQRAIEASLPSQTVLLARSCLGNFHRCCPAFLPHGLASALPTEQGRWTHAHGIDIITGQHHPVRC